MTRVVPRRNLEYSDGPSHGLQTKDTREDQGLLPDTGPWESMQVMSSSSHLAVPAHQALPSIQVSTKYGLAECSRVPLNGMIGISFAFFSLAFDTVVGISHTLIKGES